MNEEQGKELDVETPLGKLRTKGYRFGDVAQVIGVVCLTLLAYMVHEMRMEAKTAAVALAGSAKAEHDTLAAAIERGTQAQLKTVEAQAEMNYILTLSAEERTRLRLSMPESMRRKLRFGEQ